MENRGFEGKSLIAIALCLFVWWAWQRHLEQKYPRPKAPVADAAAKQVETGKTEVANAPASAPASAAQASALSPAVLSAPKDQIGEKYSYENSFWKVTLSPSGARVSEVEIKTFLSPTGESLKILNFTEPGGLMTPVAVDGEGQDTRYLNYKLVSRTENKFVFETKIKGLQIQKTFVFRPDNYGLSLELTFSGNTQIVKSFAVELGTDPIKKPTADQALSFLVPGGIGEYKEAYFNTTDSKDHREMLTTDDYEKKTYNLSGMAALGSRYFTNVMVNRSDVVPSGEAAREGGFDLVRLVYPVVPGAAQIRFNLDYFGGPKVFKDLKRFDASLTKVVDFGMFSFIAIPLLDVMKWFYGIIKNWGVAIILLTILVRLITLPFTLASYKSMKGMQKIQPEIKRLQEVYKNDTQKLNAEMMKLMRDNKVNPMGGCLPMLLQLPIFFALYQVLQNSIELYRAPFIFWIADLSQKDPYFVLPVLMGIAMFMQQKLTPTTLDPAQARIMLFMPILFTFLMVSLPSGLTLYIFVSTLFGILQQVYILSDKKTESTAVVRRA
ncbi:MAG: membrane protein insertase YidC [Oligoflexia bacterium]|nr:membrane protein insertase YidC [Oligoflexia bacterium]